LADEAHWRLPKCPGAASDQVVADYDDAIIRASTVDVAVSAAEGRRERRRIAMEEESKKDEEIAVAKRTRRESPLHWSARD